MYGRQTWQELFDSYTFESKRLDRKNREDSLKLIRKEINRRLRVAEKNGQHARGRARKMIALQRRENVKKYRR